MSVPVGSGGIISPGVLQETLLASGCRLAVTDTTTLKKSGKVTIRGKQNDDIRRG